MTQGVLRGSCQMSSRWSPLQSRHVHTEIKGGHHTSAGRASRNESAGSATVRGAHGLTKAKDKQVVLTAATEWASRKAGRPGSGAAGLTRSTEGGPGAQTVTSSIVSFQWDWKLAALGTALTTGRQRWQEKDTDLHYVAHVESAGGLVEMKKPSVTAGGLAWTPGGGW